MKHHSHEAKNHNQGRNHEDHHDDHMHHRIHRHDEFEEDEHWWKRPAQIVVGALLVFLLVTFTFSHYGVKLDPEPSGIPSLDSVMEGIDFGIFEKINHDSYRAYVSDDPDIKLIADRVVSASCMEHGVCHAKALFYFAKENVDYIHDPASREYIKTAAETLQSGGGDCDDSSVLIATLLESVGFKTRFIFVPGHVYVQAYIPEALGKYTDKDGWVSMDGTCQPCKFGEIAPKYSKVEKKIVY